MADVFGDRPGADLWDAQEMKGKAGMREYIESTELWCPSKAPGVRKSQLPRKTLERRESLSNQNEDRRLKEKASWFRAANNAQHMHFNGYWTPAKCKLSEEGEGCILNIYLDETVLQYSIYIHLVRCTDIRPAHLSLFFRSDCLSIHVKAGQSWLDGTADETVYIHFPGAEQFNNWLALLRSYAVVESYGKRLAPDDGGLYRMWRQVQLEVNQARSLGVARTIHSDGAISPQTALDFTSVEVTDMEVYCEIIINEDLCGRTTVKRSIGVPEWHEQFTFSDLPPFGELCVHVYRERRVNRPQRLGTITIVLGNFRRGEVVDGWFPVLAPGQLVLQVGEIRLKMKIDEEIILPSKEYSLIMQSLSQKNLLDLLSDLESELKIGHVAEHMLALAVARNVLLRDLFELADREVDEASSSGNTLFRGNTIYTKTMELTMGWYGRTFLESSVGRVVRHLCSEKVAIEVDPMRCSKGPKDLERNVDSLVQWCNNLWEDIYAVRDECPNELRQLFHHIRQLVEKRFGKDANRELKWQSVSAFCFLRFIVPAVLHPHLFGICPGMPPVPVQRSLTLIAKVLQSLANLNQSSHKEEYMRKVKLFLQHSRPAMVDYILVVSTPVPEQRPQVAAPSIAAYKHQRIHILNSLRERSANMPTLHREAILLLPHLLDVSKHLAILTSAIVRNCRKARIKAQCAQNSILEDFSRKCCDVEDKALEAVTQLIRKRNVSLGRPSAIHTHTHGESGSSTCQSCITSGSLQQPTMRSSRLSTSSSSFAEMPEDFVKVPSYPASPTGDFVKESFRDVVWQTFPKDVQSSSNKNTLEEVSPTERMSVSNERRDETRKKRGILAAFLGNR